MKKLIFIFVSLCCLGMGVRAQSIYYAKAGLNLNSARVLDINTGERLPTGLNTDFCIAFGYTYKIKEAFFVQFGFEWMARGYRNKFFEPWERNMYLNGLYSNIENKKAIASAYYLGIPITVAYYIDINELKFFVQGGVYTSVGIYGSETITGRRTDGKNYDDEWRGVFLAGDVNLGNNNYYVLPKKRIDNGLIFGIGLELDDFQFGIQYHRSLSNALRNDFDLKYRTFSFYVLCNFDFN